MAATTNAKTLATRHIPAAPLASPKSAGRCRRSQKRLRSRPSKAGVIARRGLCIAGTARGPARMRRFEGTDTYVATQDLQVAVNAAIALERPLLVKGEPGTGKTILAHEVARGVARELITWHIKST